MTFREKLADWISGGALDEERRMVAVLLEQLHDRHQEMAKFEIALREICDSPVTSKSSGTAKRIHRIAKEALSDD